MNKYFDEINDFVENIEFNKSEMECCIGARAIGFWFVNSLYFDLLFDKIAIVNRIQ